ncbi:MAG: efflux transporter outer membrane subunit [Pseudomonadota bacterium]
MRSHTLVALAISTLLGACGTMAPAYQQPAAPVPATWPSGAAYAPADAPANTGAQPGTNTSTAPATDLAWRDFVHDDRLRKVIAQALADSRDLRKTLADIESARAQYRVQRAAQLPTVDAGVSGSRARSLSSASGNSNTTVQTQSYTANLGVSSYEVDLFGRVRSLTGAALETYLATEEAARTTRISLIAETATAWIAYAADSSQRAIAQRTMDSAERSMALTRKRLEAGVASRVDVRQAETVYQQARADVASYTTAVAQDRNALELLVGNRVDDALLPDALPNGDTDWVADVPAGVSSNVLLQRPDVLQAEHQLKSANANIGAARAALFPSLTLTGTGGVASAALSTLLSGGATVWTLAPALSLPIFDGGAGRANVAYAEAQQKGYVASYELAIQTAFKEVADALARRGTMQEQLAAQTDLVSAAQDSYDLSNARYTKGVDTFLTALDSQRTLYSAQQTLVTARQTALANQVLLYRVLGGGAALGESAPWTSSTP